MQVVINTNVVISGLFFKNSVAYLEDIIMFLTQNEVKMYEKTIKEYKKEIKKWKRKL